MSALTLPGARPEPAGTPPDAAKLQGAPSSGEKFPRAKADPQDDWPLDVHLPDEKEDEEC